jgi:hypothetical protein
VGYDRRRRAPKPGRDHTDRAESVVRKLTRPNRLPISRACRPSRLFFAPGACPEQSRRAVKSFSLRSLRPLFAPFAVKSFFSASSAAILRDLCVSSFFACPSASL